MHSIYDALPVPNMPVRVTRGALVSHRYTQAAPCYRTLQYRRTLSMSLWNDFSEPVFHGVGLAGFKVGPMFFYWHKLLARFLSSTVSPFSSFSLYICIAGLGTSD